MFALAVRMNHLSGKWEAIERALAMLTILGFMPLGLLLVIFRSDLGLVLTLVAWVASYFLHRHLLIRRRKGLRMLARYDALDPVDLIAFKLLASVAVIGCFGLSLLALETFSGAKLDEPAVLVQSTDQ